MLLRAVRAVPFVLTPFLAAPAAAQVFSGTLIPPAAGAGAQVGDSAALDGDVAVLGAPFHDGTGTDSGGAWAFRRNGSGQWASVQKLVPLDGAAADFFGESVSVSGDRILVGAPFDDDLSSASGSAYVFEHDGSSWVQADKLLASDGANADLFGFAVSLAGDLAVVGAYQDDDPFFGQGSAYVFQRQGGGDWVEIEKLTPGDGAPDDRYGYAVATDGARVVVGAKDHDALAIDCGAVYVYENFQGAWIEHKLLPNGGNQQDGFGIAVAIEGDRVLVGAHLADGAAGLSGAAYVFERNPGGGWFQVAKFTTPGQSPGDQFGWSVALDGDRALVGSRLDDPAGNSDAGAAYLFERNGAGVWLPIKTYVSIAPGPGDTFGSGVGIDGDTLLISSRLDDTQDTNTGSAEVYLLPEWYGVPASVSVAAGGSHVLRLDRPVSDGSKIYFVLGSASGTSPALPIDGVLLPLAFDGYFLLSLQAPNSGLFGNTLGGLDTNGNATATITLPAGLDPALAGATLHHAAVVFAPGTVTATYATAAAPLALVP